MHETDDSSRTASIVSTLQPDNGELIVTYSFVCLHLYLTLICICLYFITDTQASIADVPEAEIQDPIADVPQADVPQPIIQAPIVDVPQPPKRRARKRMVGGMRVSGKHGEYSAASQGGRKSRERIYGYVMEAISNNKYLVRFDNSTEKECFSNTLKIEVDTAALPGIESVQATDNVALMVINREDDVANDESESENDEPEADLANEHGVVNVGDINESTVEPESVVNIGDINESADIPADDTDEIEIDARPETYHDRLRRTRADIGRLVGDKVSKKSSGNEIIWEVIVNHTAPELTEIAKDAQKEQINNIGYTNIKELLVAEGFEDPALASDDGTSNSATPLRPTDINECTVFAKLWLLLSFKNWRRSLEKFNDCIKEYNEDHPKNIKEFSSGEFLTSFSLFIGAVVFSMNGNRLWDIKGDSKSRDLEWASLVQPPGYNNYMRLYRFKQFRTIIPKIYEQVDLKDTDPWWQFKGAIDDFNAIRKASKLLVFVHLFAFGSNFLSCIVL